MVHFSCICTVLLAMFMYTEAYVAMIDCSNRKGSSEKSQFWDCKRDGTIKCTVIKEDCSSGENYGQVTSGYTTYKPSGDSFDLGGSGWTSFDLGGSGWDCRLKCDTCFVMYSTWQSWTTACRGRACNANPDAVHAGFRCSKRT